MNKQHTLQSTPDQSTSAAPSASRRTLFEVAHNVPQAPRPRYIDHVFDVPAGASTVGATVTFNAPLLLYLSLHDIDGFRGNRMNPSATGQVALELWVAPDAASDGGVAGVLPPGQWTARLNLRRLGEDTGYQLVVYAEFEAVPTPISVEYPADHVARPEPGWYQGELHAHSTESDGTYPVETVVQAAIAAELDFISLTDHYTNSQWSKMAGLINDQVALLRSCELTDTHGHANLQGIDEWIDVYVGRPDWSMNDAADQTHARGGLFCVNHAFSGYLGWRTEDFEWDKVDLLEVYHNLEGPNNNLLLPLWDHHLRLGRRIVGVGGIDSHDPFVGWHALGQVVTRVYADELSERGIIAGLRRGQVYVSRGPELRFAAVNSRGDHAGMWDTLERGGPITFEVRLTCEQPLHVFLLKNGYPYEQHKLESSPGFWQTLTFIDDPIVPAYYRVEVHSRYQAEAHPNNMWRDWTTMQVLSNPIWIRA